MRPRAFPRLLIAVVLVLVCVAPVVAQPIATLRWQLAPYCDLITLTVTQTGGTLTLDGFDTRCDTNRLAAVTGVALPNPNGTVGLGFTIVTTPAGAPIHVDATVDLATLSGTWTSALAGGAFVLNGPGDSGIALTAGYLSLTRFNNFPFFASRRINGTLGVPLAIDSGETLLAFDAHGSVDGAVAGLPSASIRVVATEDWTPGGQGSLMNFATTRNGQNFALTQMTIANDGFVGIGTANPVAKLHVTGDIRIGNGTTGCVHDGNGTIIAGVCASDARFKRAINAFGPLLDKVASLRPVNFFWRADEFPSRAFGDRASYGLVAQEVEQVLPELVVTDADGYKAVNYSRLPLVAIQAIKELKVENDAVKARLAHVERLLTELQTNKK
jgi:hypothetical protein